tara:strand:- start:382 stop:840 length:459 start_codon:yes stop_codon:yes gene_type:complete
MRVSDYLKEKFCIMDLKATDKDSAIKEIAQCLGNGGRLTDEGNFVNDVLEREKLGSTGIGHNVGIPHARTAAVKGFIIGFGRSNEGIDFNALDGEKVKLVFLMGADPAELNLYLRILAELSKLLMNTSFRQELISAKGAAEVISTIKKFEKS